MSLLGGSAAAPGVHVGGREGAEGVPGSSALHHIRQASQGSLSQQFLRTLRLTVQVIFFNPFACEADTEQRKDTGAWHTSRSWRAQP